MPACCSKGKLAANYSDWIISFFLISPQHKTSEDSFIRTPIPPTPTRVPTLHVWRQNWQTGFKSQTYTKGRNQEHMPGKQDKHARLPCFKVKQKYIVTGLGSKKRKYHFCIQWHRMEKHNESVYQDYYMLRDRMEKHNKSVYQLCWWMLAGPHPTGVLVSHCCPHPSAVAPPVSYAVAARWRWAGLYDSCLPDRKQQQVSLVGM